MLDYTNAYRAPGSHSGLEWILWNPSEYQIFDLPDDPCYSGGGPTNHLPNSSSNLPDYHDGYLGWKYWVIFLHAEQKPLLPARKLPLGPNPRVDQPLDRYYIIIKTK